MPNICKGIISENWTTYRCSRNAQPDKDYCKTHDPDIQAAKRAAKHAQWDDEAKQATALRNILPVGWHLSIERKGIYRVTSGSLTAEQMKQFILDNCKGVK